MMRFPYIFFLIFTHSTHSSPINKSIESSENSLKQFNNQIIKNKIQYYKKHFFNFYSLTNQSFHLSKKLHSINIRNLQIHIINTLTNKIQFTLNPFTKKPFQFSQKFYIVRDIPIQPIHPYIIYRKDSSILTKAPPHTFAIQSPLVQYTFSKPIDWIIFFNSYLIFMESSLKQNKNFISFVDLNYFKSILGKNYLPVFHIPIEIDSLKKKKLLHSPLFIQVENEAITLRGIGNFQYKLKLDELKLIAQAQEISFNAIFSILKNREKNTELIIKNALSKINSLLKKEIDEHHSLKLTHKMISSQMHFLSQIDSTSYPKEFKTSLHTQNSCKKIFSKH